MAFPSRWFGVLETGGSIACAGQGRNSESEWSPSEEKGPGREGGEHDPGDRGRGLPRRLCMPRGHNAPNYEDETSSAIDRASKIPSHMINNAMEQSDRPRPACQEDVAAFLRKEVETRCSEWAQVMVEERTICKDKDGKGIPLARADLTDLKARNDIRFSGWHLHTLSLQHKRINVMVEIDEDQHRGRDQQYEGAREVGFCSAARAIFAEYDWPDKTSSSIFIRFNPDGFTDEENTKHGQPNGKNKHLWRGCMYECKDCVCPNWERRKQILSDCIIYFLTEWEPDGEDWVVKLFYDGFEFARTDFSNLGHKVDKVNAAEFIVATDAPAVGPLSSWDHATGHSQWDEGPSARPLTARVIGGGNMKGPGNRVAEEVLQWQQGSEEEHVFSGEDRHQEMLGRVTALDEGPLQRAAESGAQGVAGEEDHLQQTPGGRRSQGRKDTTEGGRGGRDQAQPVLQEEGIQGLKRRVDEGPSRAPAGQVPTNTKRFRKALSNIFPVLREYIMKGEYERTSKCIDGYLGLRKEGDEEDVHLWETRTGLENVRLFLCGEVDVESAVKCLNIAEKACRDSNV